MLQNYQNQENAALQELKDIYAQVQQQTTSQEVFEKMQEKGFIDLRLEQSQQDDKYRNALSVNGQAYRDNMFLYFDRLKTVMDGRKWSTLVYSFIKNFYSTDAQIKAKSALSQVKRNNTLISKSQGIEGLDAKTQAIANQLLSIGTPTVINDQVVFVNNGKVWYPGKSVKQFTTDKQLQNKIDYLKYYNHSKKLKKQSIKNLKTPGRLARRAFAKSFAKRVNAEGRMKKAIAKLPANEFSAIRNINDIPLVYHDKVNKKVLNAFAVAKQKLNTKRIAKMMGQDVQVGVANLEGQAQQVIQNAQQPVQEQEQPLTQEDQLRINQLLKFRKANLITNLINVVNQIDPDAVGNNKQTYSGMTEQQIAEQIVRAEKELAAMEIE